MVVRTAVQAFVCAGRPFSFYDAQGRVMLERLQAFCVNRPNQVSSVGIAKRHLPLLDVRADPVRNAVADRLVQVQKEHTASSFSQGARDPLAALPRK